MKELVTRYNKTFLPDENNFKLVSHHLWRIYFCPQLGHSHCFRTNNISLSHQAVYIQNRHNQPDEPVAGIQKRKQAVCVNPIGSDYSKHSNVKTIDGWLRGADGGTLDGVYMQYQKPMMGPEGSKAMRNLASRYDVGI